MGEGPNDRNDRAIRVATAWYKQRLPGMPILLLTNDVANRQKSQQQGLTALSVQVGRAGCISKLLLYNVEVCSVLLSDWQDI